MEDDTKKRLIEAIEKIERNDILDYLYIIVSDILDECSGEMQKCKAV